MDEVRKLEKKRDECVTRLDSVKSTKSRLEKEIKTEYPHPTEKLLQMLSSFERDLQVIRHKNCFVFIKFQILVVLGTP